MTYIHKMNISAPRIIALVAVLLCIGAGAYVSIVPKIAHGFVAADGSEVINCTFPDGTSKRMTRDQCRAQGGGDNGCVGDEVSMPGGECAQTLTGSGSSGSPSGSTSKSPSNNTGTPAGTTDTNTPSNTNTSPNTNASSDNSFKAPDGSEKYPCKLKDGTSPVLTRDECRAQGGEVEDGCPGDEIPEGGQCVQPLGGGSGTPGNDSSGKGSPSTPSTNTPTSPGGTPTQNTPGGACPDGTICNPLKVNSIEELVLTIIDVVLVFLLPVIVLYIMYAGYLFVTAQGNPGELKTAKNALLTALIGGVIVLGARAILDVVKGTINSVTNDSSMNVPDAHINQYL